MKKLLVCVAVLLAIVTFGPAGQAHADEPICINGGVPPYTVRLCLPT